MEAKHKVGAVQLSASLRGVSPPMTRRLRVAEQISPAELHAALQVAFGWSDGHLYRRAVRSGCWTGMFEAVGRASTCTDIADLLPVPIRAT
jgi:hypothetical protein